MNICNTSLVHSDLYDKNKKIKEKYQIVLSCLKKVNFLQKIFYFQVEQESENLSPEKGYFLVVSSEYMIMYKEINLEEMSGQLDFSLPVDNLIQ